MRRPVAPHIPYLDGWRGLAIVLLLAGHFFPVAGINLGAVGVNLFFVLSGFLMARLLFIDETPLAIFYKRRISRILPAVFFFIGAVLLAYGALGRSIDWAETATAVAFVKNYLPGAPGRAEMPFGHIWTLSVEEHSYIVLSLAALAARAGLVRARTALGVLTVLSAATGLWYWSTYTGVRLEFDRWMRTEVAAFGILASSLLMVSLHGRRLPRVPLPVVPALLGFGLAMHWWVFALPLTTFAGVGAFALALNLLRDTSARVHAILSVAPLRRLGTWSFSIYLWQQPFYLYCGDSLGERTLAAALAVAAGIASFYLIEQPARARLNRYWARRTAAAGAGTQPGRPVAVPAPGQAAGS